MAKQIPLSQGKFATVDDEDFEFLSGFKWSAVKNKSRWYAVRRPRVVEGRPPRNVFMHRELLNIDCVHVDHIDGDGLNNTRANLRGATRAQNYWNQAKTRGASKYKGVHFHRLNGRWRARIMASGKQISLGLYASEEDAALAYNNAAQKLFGQFARLNIIT